MKREQLVDLSGLSSGNVGTGSLNLNGKFISSTPKNPAIKTAPVLLRRAPSPAGNLDALEPQETSRDVASCWVSTLHF